MISKKRTLILMSLLVFSAKPTTRRFIENKKLYEYSLYGITIVSTMSCLYSWITKKGIEKNFENFKNRFKNQSFLDDRYAQALETMADYIDYIEIIQSQLSAEEIAQKMCRNIQNHHGKNSTMLSLFKKEVEIQHSLLAQQNKEIDRALIDWQDSKKKALLSAQVPIIKKTLEQCLAGLETLKIQIPYVESMLFMQNHRHLLKEEIEFAKHPSSPEQLAATTVQLVRNKTRIGERYPFRTYTKTIEVYLEQVSALENELNYHKYYPFQDEVISFIKRTSETLDVLKKQLKASQEFQAECAQFDAEILAIAHEQEILQLKEKLTSSMKATRS